MCSFYCLQRNGEKIGLSPIRCIIHTVTIGTMLNYNGDNNGHGLKDVFVIGRLKLDVRYEVSIYT